MLIRNGQFSSHSGYWPSVEITVRLVPLVEPTFEIMNSLLSAGRMAALSREREFVGAAFGLVVVAALTLRLLSFHSEHFTSVVRSRSNIADEQRGDSCAMACSERRRGNP